MAKGLIEENTLKGIADAIRAKNGSTDTLSPSEMASAIASISTVPVGSIMLWAGIDIPQNWALCNGEKYKVEENPELYAAIGDTYGSGPTGFFRIPDLTHRFPLGWGYSDTLGEKGGEEEHNHVENVFAYNGKLAVSNTDLAAQTSKSEIYTVNGTTGFTPVSGTQKGDVYRTEKSSNMPPYLRIKFIIKVK